MSEAERQAFLRDPVRPAMVSTVRADGRPHVAPIWYDLDGDVLVFTTGASTVKGHNLQPDPPVALCVQDDKPPYSFVLLEGLAQLSEDPGELRSWAAHIGGRYMGGERAEAYGARNGVPGEVLVRVSPLRWSSAAAVAD